MTDTAPAIGIDLGTTYSCVAVFQNGRVKVIPNESGHRITPSCVSFTSEGHIVGDDAKYRLTMNPRNTVFEVKRLMGKPFNDPSVAKNMQYWPFEVRAKGNKPEIVVYPGGATPSQCYEPEEISARILIKMKTIAEDYLKKTVSEAVITVPAYFNESQRQATKTAGHIAGLKVLRIINEPEAAAIAYGLQTKTQEEQNILVFDLGGGTFDVSVLSIEGGIIEVRAKCGDTNLGGTDFDNVMVDDCLNYFNKGKNTSTPVTNDCKTRPFNRLRRACEFAKCRLSDDEETFVQIEQFHGDIDLRKTIERKTFEMLNTNLLNKTLDLVKQVLVESKLNKNQINEILLVGGSTRIPKLQAMLKEFFEGKELNRSIHPDEAVAYGAAAQAAVLQGDPSEELEGMLLMDITPLSLGIEIKSGIMSTIIKKNTLIPISCKERYVTVDDNQTSATINIYQGERTLVKDNHQLGSFTMDKIRAAPAGVAKIDVTFDMDSDGILDVIAEDLSTGNEECMTIKDCPGRVSNEEVTRMIQEAGQHQKEDEETKAKLVARNDLESLTRWMKLIIKECTAPSLKIGAQNLKQIQKFCDEIITWLNRDQIHSEAEYTYKKDRLRVLCQNIPTDYTTPGQLPQILRSKYPALSDTTSMSSFHSINPDLD